MLLSSERDDIGQRIQVRTKAGLPRRIQACDVSIQRVEGESEHRPKAIQSQRDWSPAM